MRAPLTNVTGSLLSCSGSGLRTGRPGDFPVWTVTEQGWRPPQVVCPIRGGWMGPC